MFVGEGSEGEYTITLAYNTKDVNALPKKESPELDQVLGDVVAMLKTLKLKPPILISSLEPQTAHPGATVTLHGSGFAVPNWTLLPSFVLLPNLTIAPPTVASDGRSMTFEIPASKMIISCDKPGYVDVDENCVPAPSAGTYTACPPLNDLHPTFCGVPLPPGVYQIRVHGQMVDSNEVSLTVVAPQPTPVSISLLYPNYLVLPGDAITVRGSGFTPTGNTVRIGDAVVNNIASPDGTALSLEAPTPAGTSFIPGLYYYKLTVSNANGESNPITLDYRYANVNALRWQKISKPANTASQPSSQH